VSEFHRFVVDGIIDPAVTLAAFAEQVGLSENEAEEFDRSAQKIIDTMVRYNVATLGELPAAIRKTHESGDR